MGCIPHGKSLILHRKSLGTPQKELLDPPVPHVGGVVGSLVTQEMLLHPLGMRTDRMSVDAFGNQLLRVE